MVKKFVLFILLVLSLPSFSWASGCDESCWQGKSKVLVTTGWDLKTYFQLSPAKNKTSVHLTAKPGSESIGFSEEVDFSGYEWEAPLDASLVERLLDPAEKYQGTVFKADVEFEIHGYTGPIKKAKTGQYILTIRFEYGETANLYYPSFAEVVERGDGAIHHDQLLPLFFTKNP